MMTAAVCMYGASVDPLQEQIQDETEIVTFPGGWTGTAEWA